MTERAEFEIDRGRVGTSGILLCVLGLLVLSVPFWLPRFDTGIAVLSTGLGLAIIGLGILTFRLRNVTGVQVVVDRDGITDLRLSPDPIPWSEVERLGLTLLNARAAPRLKLILRPGSPLIAARFRSGTVVINDTTLRGHTNDLRAAIARLAPQVPRDW
jgi:hypothetical protein